MKIKKDQCVTPSGHLFRMRKVGHSQYVTLPFQSRLKNSKKVLWVIFLEGFSNLLEVHLGRDLRPHYGVPCVTVKFKSPIRPRFSFSEWWNVVFNSFVWVLLIQYTTHATYTTHTTHKYNTYLGKLFVSYILTNIMSAPP